jgi:hypothetical protein
VGPIRPTIEPCAAAIAARAILDPRSIRIADAHRRFTLAHHEDDNMTVVPIPGADNTEERQRIRKSNDRDQRLERQGKQSRHNRGYDEAADGVAPPPEIERVVDE